MNFSLLHRIDALPLSAMLFVAMLLLVIIGRYAARLLNKEGEEPPGGVKSLLTALYALSGFILAFTFGMSGTRFEKVRVVTETEANAIGTAVLRADLFSDSVRQVFRADLKVYLEAVVTYYNSARDMDSLMKSLEDADKASNRLWTLAIQQSKQPGMLIPSSLMIPALNAMFDIGQRRHIVLLSRVPDLIIYLLFICVLTTCFVGGYTSKTVHNKDWIIIVGFALVTVMVIYTTLDLSRPMRGLIKTDPGLDAIKEMLKMF